MPEIAAFSKNGIENCYVDPHCYVSSIYCDSST